MLKKRSFLWITIPVLVIIFFLQDSLRSASACEPTTDQWFVESYEIAGVDIPKEIVIQPYTNGMGENFIYIQLLSEKNLSIIPTTVIPNDEISKASKLALYQLPSDQFPNGLTLSMNDLVKLDPSLEDQRKMAYSPPPANVGVPADGDSELLLVYDEQIFRVPFRVFYQVNSNFSAYNCSDWWDSAEATEEARYEATQAADLLFKQRTSENLSSTFGGLFIFVGIVALIVLALVLQRKPGS